MLHGGGAAPIGTDEYPSGYPQEGGFSPLYPATLLDGILDGAPDTDTSAHLAHYAKANPAHHESDSNAAMGAAMSAAMGVGPEVRSSVGSGTPPHPH